MMYRMYHRKSGKKTDDLGVLHINGNHYMGYLLVHEKYTEDVVIMVITFIFVSSLWEHNMYMFTRDSWIYSRNINWGTPNFRQTHVSVEYQFVHWYGTSTSSIDRFVGKPWVFQIDVQLPECRLLGPGNCRLFFWAQTDCFFVEHPVL